MLATKRFKVSRPLALWLYAGLLLLGIVTLVVGALARPANFEPKTVFAGFALVALGSLQLRGCFLVREIEIDGNSICFRPVGVRVPFSELGTMKEVYRDSIGSVQRMTFRLPAQRPAQRSRWLPGTLVWVPGFVSINLVGADGDAICAELERRLPGGGPVSQAR